MKTTFLTYSRIIPPKFKRPLILVFLMMLVTMFLETMSIGLIVPAISMLTQPDALQGGVNTTSWLPFTGSLSQAQFILGGLALLVSVFLLKSICLSYFIWKQNAFSYSLLMHLTEELYLGYLRSPWLFHVQNNSAYLIRNINLEVSQAINNVLMPILKLISESLVVTGIAALLLFFEPVGTLAVMLFMLFSGLAIQKITKKSLLRWGELRLLHEGKRILQLQQGLAAVKEIKLLGREAQFLEEFKPHNLQSALAIQHKLFYQQLPRLFLEVIAVGGLAVLISALLVQGKAVTSFLPIVGLFAAAVFRLMPSVNRIIDSMQNIHYGMPSVKVLQSQIDFIRKFKKTNTGMKLSFMKDIKFKDVAFSYPETGKNILCNLNLEIRKGEVVGLIGNSGSGKTTLVDLLLGLLSPATGKILVDGLDIESNIEDWQSNLGYVQQTINLLDDTLINNIAFGLPDQEIDMECINSAVKSAQLDDLIASLPEGLYTNIGEKGVKLSGGQRQRIGIARALYRNPKIIVLDEATSALDTDTEKLIMDAIYGLGRDKTIIIIAHRLSTVSNCDKIYRLEEGHLGLVEIRHQDTSPDVVSRQE